MSDTEIDKLRAAIAGLERQRGQLDDALLELSTAPLRARLAALQPGQQTPQADAERRLRQVSVLFLDIVGSTRLMENLDPEDVQAVVDEALAAFTVLVRQHGGEVLRYAGDNIKAAFGADGTREDDAERAVNCGLALLQEAARRGGAVRQAHGLARFDARVGIHTGPVVRGGGVEQDNSLSGLAVNIAARMEQAAPPGTLRISMDAWRQVQGRFDVEEQPALQVKGLEELMRTFLVQGARERRLRGLRHGADGVTSTMVGRDDELVRLQRLAAAVLAPGGLGTATVIGEAGLGKSRLLAEFQAGLPAATRGSALWRASSHPQALYQPYGLIRDLLFWHLGVRDSDTQEQAQRTFGAGLLPFFGAAAEEHTALLGQLIGLDYSASPFIAGILSDGKQLQGRGLNAWIRCLTFQAAEKPLVLVLDDLQWADDESLNALDHLVNVAPELPVLLLCAARPELLQRRPQWGAQWPAHALIQLSPLAAQGSAALAAALLTRFAEPVPALQALLSEQSAGNPYYMEALLQMLVDKGVIETAGDHWQMREERLPGLKVPSTLVGVLQATLDALDGQARRSLQQASVVGAQFWDEALAAIDPQAPGQLPMLSQRELTLPQPQSAFEGTREYSFRHHLLHEVTYGTVLKPDKRQAHGLAARWLQGRSQGRENELASQIAEHFDRAGDKDQAIAHWLSAAEDSSRRQADTSALAHVDRALALDAGTDLPRQVRLHRIRMQVFRRIGRFVEHGQEVAVLESLADRLDSDALRMDLTYDLTWRLHQDARYAEAVALAESRLANASALAWADANVYYLIANCLGYVGRRDDAMALAHKGLGQARASGDVKAEGLMLSNIGLQHMEADRPTQALQYYEQALAICRASGDRNGTIVVRIKQAVTEEMIYRMANARALLEGAIADCRESGSLRLEGAARANLSYLLVGDGESQGGYDMAMEGLRLARISAERRTTAFAHRGATAAAFALGRWAAAIEHARAGRTAFDQCGLLHHARQCAAKLALSLLASAQPAEALVEADALLLEVAEHGGWGDACVPFDVYRLMNAMNDERASGLLTASYDLLCVQAEACAEVIPVDTYMQATVNSRAICEAWAAARSGNADLDIVSTVS